MAKWVGWLLLLVSVGLITMSREQTESLFREPTHQEQQYYLPSPQALRLLSLGYREAISSLIWCKALLYFGEEMLHQSPARFVAQYGHTMTDLDPDFREAYRWTARSLLYRAGNPTEADAELASTTLSRAVERFPADPTLSWELGSTLVFEWAPLAKDPQARRKLESRALPYLMDAARGSSGPSWLPLTIATLLERNGRSEDALQYLRRSLVNTTNVSLRSRISARIQDLQKPK